VALWSTWDADIDVDMKSESDVVYPFNRSTCFGFSVFMAALVVMSILVVVLAGDQMFVEGFVPGWLFGSFGAALFSVVGVWWARRVTHRGPALVLSPSGITVHRLQGGPFSHRVERLIRWEEIAAVSDGPYGSVVLRLEDPEGWLADQSLLSRFLAWHPSPHRRGMVSVGGLGLGSGPQDLFQSVQSRVDQVRVERRNNETLGPGDVG